jgi:hypothetical protein
LFDLNEDGIRFKENLLRNPNWIFSEFLINSKEFSNPLSIGDEEFILNYSKDISRANGLNFTLF